jgi:hypothetical protein
MDLTSFNIHEVEPMGTFEPLPADWYKCVISAAEQRDTKAMDGSYLMLTIEVIEGSYQGRKIFDRLNLQNKNPVAVDIARRSLASIAKAVGVDPQDSADLIDIPLMVKVAVREASGGYDASNDVKGYDAASGASASVAAAPVAAVASNGAGSPPWKR